MLMYLLMSVVCHTGGHGDKDVEDDHTHHEEVDAVALDQLKASTVDCLRKAFNLLDEDCSGFIELSVGKPISFLFEIILFNNNFCCIFFLRNWAAF